MNFRISGQKMKQKSSEKYLGLIIDEFLNWKTHYTILRSKLERSIGLLAKLGYYVSPNLLRTVYYAIFDSYVRYGFEIWAQNKNAGPNEIYALQDKALRVMSFKDRNIPPGPLYNEKKIIKFFNLVMHYNCLFIADHLNQNVTSSFGGYFTYMADHHNHNTGGSLKKLVNVPLSKTTFYGTQSIIAKSVNDWDDLQNRIVFVFDNDHVVTPKLITALKNHFLE